MALDFVAELTASMAVTSLDRSIAWYQEVLGFTLLYRAEEIGWCELATHMPGVNVGLSENRDVPQGGGATNVWSVTNVEAAKAHLDTHGVQQDGEIQTIPGLVRLLTFYDPDGNAMMFAQSLVEG
ncbi:VOC family protein [Novosphingobium sp. B 225]|uniref:VOC family protein n=1 Tax=Novosphingobium sp. B 225 TaxID=1961849 RepID=UPI000B4B1107|nr:VOC family protein [Novosphingobium sp. B 225]